MSCLKTTALLLLCFFLLCSCSGDREKEVEQGPIDTMTTEVGRKAAQQIRTPLDKARAVSDLAEQRVQEIEEKTNQ